MKIGTYCCTKKERIIYNSNYNYYNYKINYNYYNYKINYNYELFIMVHTIFN